MADGAGQPAADWYDDPHYPGRMRYFDGEAWTDHFHYPGQLPSIGEWLGTTFTVFRQHWMGAAAIALVASLVGNLLVWIPMRSILGDVAVVNEELVNFDAGVVFGLLVVILLAVLWQAVGWLALNRFMQRAHFQAEPSVGEACRRAAQRLPRYLGLILALTAAVMMLFVLVVASALVSPALAVLLGFMLIPGFVWAYVKLSFLTAAAAAAPSDSSALRSSADVSTGRFWGILGRLLVLTIGLGISANVVGAIGGDLGSPVDQDATIEIFEAEGSEFIVRDFKVSDLLPSTSALVGVVLFTTVIGAATNMISTSAMMRLYLDSGAPSELDA